MSTKAEATIADLERFSGKAELVHGELVVMSPTGGLPGYSANAISAALYTYSLTRKSGCAVGDNVGFIVDLPHRKSFSPDAAFYAGTLSMDFVAGAPLFAVEVRSKGDYGPRAEKEIAAKRADYFAAGTLVVWDVDLLSADIVRAFRSDRLDVPARFGRGDVADAEPALPGWRLAVDKLFPPA